MGWLDTLRAALIAKLKLPTLGDVLPRPQWRGQHTNPTRAARRRAIKAAGGIRQFKKSHRTLVA